MIIVCAGCGSKLGEGERCGSCAPKRPASNLVQAVTIAAEMGRIDGYHLTLAAASLREKAS